MVPEKVDTRSHAERGMKPYNLVILLLVAMGGVALALGSGTVDSSRNFATAAEFSRMLPDSSGNQQLTYERLLPIFMERLQQYRARVFEFNANLVSQLVVIATALIVLFRPSQRMTIPVLGYKVPMSDVYFALPVCLSYLWMRMGYLLQALIEDRIVLWRLGTAMEGAIDALRAARPDLWASVVNTFSIRPLIRDWGVIDAWFVLFRSEYIEPVPGAPPLLTILALHYVVFLAVGHACILGVVWHRARLYARTPRSVRGHTAYFWLCVALLGLTHREFFVTGGHATWLQAAVVLGAAVLTTAIALWVRAVLPRSRDRKPHFE